MIIVVRCRHHDEGGAVCTPVLVTPNTVLSTAPEHTFVQYMPLLPLTHVA